MNHRQKRGVEHLLSGNRLVPSFHNLSLVHFLGWSSLFQFCLITGSFYNPALAIADCWSSSLDRARAGKLENRCVQSISQLRQESQKQFTPPIHPSTRELDQTVINQLQYKTPNELVDLDSSGSLSEIFSKSNDQPIAPQIAQQLPQPPRNLPPRNLPLPTSPPAPELTPLPSLPPPEDLLQPEDLPPPAPELAPNGEPVTLVVQRFDVVGSTVFSPEEFAAVLQPFLDRPLTLTELLQARSAITQLYVDAGYISSGAYIPPQVPEDGVVTIQVIEGQVTAIEVTGNRRLRSGYVRDRLRRYTGTPLNANQLVEGLQLLQLNPLIANISAELSAGVEPGSSILNVTVTEADSFSVNLITDNDRVPSSGSWERGIEFNQANLLGLGDGLDVSYFNTDGSNQVDAWYNLPVNARNGTVNLGYSYTHSWIIQDPFNELDINSRTSSYEVGFRQPIIQTPTQEFALSLTGSYEESENLYLEDILGDPIPFPVYGANDEGWMRVSALRFAQEWTQRGSRDVVALRSQFSLGLDVLGATESTDGPDSEFFAWLGQAQWVHLLAPDFLLLLRGEAQLTGDALSPLEQYVLGGDQTVRGYRQQLLLTDNGVLTTAEVRIPIYRNRQIDGLLQLTPFIDFGTGWNADLENPDPDTLFSVGLGLLWQMSDRLSARIDWGIPLVDVENEGNTWQEDGIYFSINFTAF